MAALGILASMLGFGESEQALMIALYIAMDSFGTACNVTGDGAIALIIDKFSGRKTSGLYNRKSIIELNKARKKKIFLETGQ